MFKERLTKPEKGNKYYIRKANGGYSPCILGSPKDNDCNVLANCVGYEVGRFNEESDENGCKFFASMNAENFYANAYKWGLKTGQVPQIGACMCWAKGKPANASDGLGHVANVEKVLSKDSVTTSESGYNSFVFKTKNRKKGSGNWGAGSNYKFLGFIYNPNIKIDIAQPIARDYNKEQLKIKKDKLRVRTYPSLSANILAYAQLDGIYDILSTIEQDGYKWLEIGKNNYIAYLEDYVELLPKEEPIEEQENWLIRLIKFLISLFRKDKNGNNNNSINN